MTRYRIAARLSVALFLASSFPALAGTPVVSTAPPAEEFVGEQFCFDADFTNTDPSETGYSPYYRIILTEDFTLGSASFLGGGVPITNEGTFAAPPGNTLTDSVSGDTVTGPENAILYTLQYPIGSVTAGSPPLTMELCVDVDANAVIDVLQTDAINITPGFALGNTPTGDNGAQIGTESSFDFTPRVVTYSLDDDTPEGERPPGPAWEWEIEACANIASDRTVTPVDFGTVDPIVLPNNVQFVGPVTFTGTGTGCTATTNPADLTTGPGGSIDLNCTSGTGTIGVEDDICATFPVYITDTLDPMSCGDDSAINQAEHVSIQKSSSGGRRPGTTRNYSVAIQVSEFVPGISRLEITDILPDGVTFGDDATVDFGSGPIPLTGALRTIANDTPGAGQTTVTFFITNATGAALPPAASGTLTYSADIDQSFSQTGDPVLARDVLTNTLTGEYDIDGAGNATNCQDTSQASFTIEDVTVQKNLVAPGGEVQPGDTVTFSLRMEIPSGDVNDIIFDDFFPLPVFDATLINTSTDLTTNPDIRYTGDDTLNLTPDSITTNAADNSLRIDWPDVSTTSPQVIEVEVDVVVSDDPFADMLPLSNLFQALTDNTPVDNRASLTTVGITVRSPSLSITKTVVGPTNNLEPGDDVTYDIVVTNDSTAEAYDVVVRDDEPAGLTGCTLDSTTGGSGAGGDSPFDADGLAFTTFDAPTSNALDGGASVTVTVTCTVAISAGPNQTITNTADVVWASAPGATAFPPQEIMADIRTRNASQPVKSVVATSESATPETAPPPLAIGEVARFRAVVQIPEGTQTNVRLVDLLPNGLTFIDDGSAAIAFVSTSNGALSATGFSQANCTAGTLEQNGAVAGITPDCTLPVFGTTFNNGTDVTLNIGDLVNNETDADDEFIVIELNAFANGAQANGTLLTNRFRLQSNETTVTSPNSAVRQVEPVLLTDKTATPGTVDAGDTITYTIRVEHDGDSLADAFDITFTDTLDGSQLTNFVFVGGPTAPAGETCTAGSASVSSGDPFGAGITITFDALPLGEVCQIQYTADAQASVVPGSTIDNTADVAYDTLTGTGDAGNTTGSTQGAQEAFNADDMASVGVAATQSAKRIDSTNLTHTDDAPDGLTDPNARPLSIGEVVRYRIEVRLPEGNAPDFMITDLLPAGLRYDTGTARIAFLAEGAGITPTPAISCSNGGTLSFTGDENDLATTEPECQIAATGGPFGSGTDPVFDFGALMNDDMDADQEFVILEFDATVLNVVNVQQGISLDNTFEVMIDGSSIGSTTTAFAVVVEPQVQCSVNAVPDPVDNRTDPTPTVSFTYTLTNNGLASAFQVGAPSANPLVIDLPAGLENISGLTVTPAGNVFLNNTTTAPAVGNFSVGGTDNRVLTAGSLLQFDPGASLQLAFDATLQASVAPGDTLNDTCVVTYRAQVSGDATTGVRDDSDLATGSGNDPINSTATLNDYRNETPLAVNTVTEEPEIGLAKAVTSGPTNNGDGTYGLVYTLVVENSGTVGLENVQVIDDLAATFAGATFTVDNVTVGSTNTTLVEETGFTGIAPNTTLLDASASTLPVGDQGTITIELTVTPGANLGPYNNAATASGDSDRTGTTVNDTSDNGTDPDGDGNGDPTDDNDVTPVTFAEAPEIGLAKAITSAPVNNGDGTYSFEYTFVVENSGDVILSQIQIVDDLATVFAGATGFTVDSLTSPDLTVNTSFTGIAPDTTLLDGTDTLAAGTSGTVVLQITVEPGGDLGPYNNTAVASGDSPTGATVNDTSDNGSDPDGDNNGDPGNDNDTTPVSFVEGPRIGLAKAITAGPTNNADGTYTLSYTFVLENAGDIELDDLEIIDPLATTFAAATSYVVDALTSSDFTVDPAFDGTPGNDNLLAAGNTLAVGADGQVLLTVTVTPGATLGPYSNSATANGNSPANVPVTDTSDDGSDPDGDNDSDPNNDSDPTDVTFTENAVIGIAKTLTGTPVNNADGSYTFSYDFVVENSGDVDLNGVQVVDNLAAVFAGATFTIDALTSPDFTVNVPGFDGDANPNLLTGTDTLAAGAQGEISLTLTVTPGSNLGPYNNSAVASGTSPAGSTPSDSSTDGGDPDANGNGDPTDDNDPTPLTFEENPSIGLAKAVTAGPTNLGDGRYRLTYAFIVENAGDVDLADVQITESLTTTFAGATFSIESLTSADLAVNTAGFDGDGDTNLLLPGQSLDAGVSATVELVVVVTPGTALGPYNNLATASGQSPGGATVNDTSTDGAVPDADGNGDPGNDSIPTASTFAENPVLGAAKASTDATPNFDNTFTSRITVVIENLGDIALGNVQIDEPIATNIAPAQVASVANVSITGDLTGLNPAFDGVSVTSLLTGSETLPVGGQATVEFDLTVNLDTGGSCAAVPLSNTVTASATSPGGTAVSDASTSGSDPDPDNDGNPGNNDDVTTVNVLTGVDGQLTVPVEVLPRDPLNVSLDDADANRDDAVVDTVTVTVTNVTNGEIESLTLTETGAATGVFEGALATEQGQTAGTNNDGTLTLVFDDVYRVTYEDALTSAGCVASFSGDGRATGFATLSGNAWIDGNTDDAFDAGEPPLEGWIIEVRDASGTVVATVNVAPDGSYTVPELIPNPGYSVTLVHPATGTVFGRISDIDLPPDTTVLDQNLPIDPSGVFYNAVDRNPVENVTVRLVNEAGTPLPPECLLPNQQPQTTAADGFYRFDLVPDADPACPAGGTYRIEFDPVDGFQPGFSQLIPPLPDPIDPTGLGNPVRVGDTASAPTGTNSTDYYTAFTLDLGDPDVIFNHIPLDPLGVERSSVRLTKRVTRPTTTIGSLVAYTITIENLSPVTLPAIDVEDLIPAGFSYVDGSARLDGQDTGFTATGPRPLRFSGIRLDAGQQRGLTYLLRVGAGVTQGTYRNTAAPTLNGFPIGNDDSADVDVIADPDFEETTIIGKVWHDRDGDGWQDEAGATGLVLSGGAFGDGRALADLPGRRSEGDNLDAHQVVFTVPKSDAPLSLISKEGSRVTLNARGELAFDHTGSVRRGRNAQDLIIVREDIVTMQDNQEAVQRTRTINVDTDLPAIRFESGQSMIFNGQLERLRDTLDSLKDKANVRVYFEGHTDNQPLRFTIKPIYGDNQGLSQSRAETVARMFQQELDLPDGAIETRGFADTQPMASNATPEGRALNRRVTIRVTYDEVTVEEVLAPQRIAGEVKQMRVRVINRGINEEGIAGVRLATVEGLVIDTDSKGRYHIAGVDGGFFERGRNYIVKVDPASLPQDSSFTTENPRVKRITQGLMNQFDFGVHVPPLADVQNTARVFEFSPAFFADGEARIRTDYLHLMPQLMAALTESGGGRVVILGDADSDMPLLQRRAMLINRALREGLGDDIRRQVEVTVMAHADLEEQPIMEPPKTSWLKQGLGILMWVFGTDVHAAEPCDLETCANDQQPVIRMYGGNGRGEPAAANTSGRYRVGLPGGGVIWATEDAASVKARLSVAGPDTLVAGRADGAVFVAYTNYGAFIDTLTLSIYDENDVDRVSPLAVLEPTTRPEAFSDFVYFDWSGATGRLPPDTRLTYVLQATDAGGRRDETGPGFIQLVTAEQQREIDEAAQARWDKHVAKHGEPPVQLDTDALLTPREAHRLLALTYGRSQLVRQNIPLHGARVRLQGADVDPTLHLFVHGHRVPLDMDGQFAAEYLLPVGEHWAELAVGNDQIGYWMKDLPVAVTGQQTFFMALADFTASSNDLNGALEPLSGNDRYAEDSLVEGRVAYYLKARIKGKYLLTSQLDSREQQIDNLLGSLDEKDTRALFRRLDPDRYYPVYGDDSTTVADTNSLGRLYVRLEWDKSEVVWGNYQTRLDGNEFTQYRRSLYGGQLSWRSVNTTSRDDTRTELTVFGSETQTALGHSEFLGTGGSLYYLRHLDILPGSDQARIEVRDADTRRTVEVVPLVRGRDYEIDELQGRIILGRPLLQVAQQSAPSLVRDGPLDGNQAILIVDYEYLPAGFDADQIAAGARGKHWFGDHVGIGATAITEGRGAEDYTLGGVDLTLAAGRGTYLKVEAARSEATQTERLFSTDGGLSFTQMNPNSTGDRAGDAIGVEARVNMQELGWTQGETTAAAWWRRTDDQFSVARRDEGVDTYEMGLEMTTRLSERTRIALRASVAERENQIEETNIGIQVDHALGEHGTLSAEARYISQDRFDGNGPVDATLLATQYAHQVTDTTRVYTGGQVTVTNDDGRYDNNDQVRVGLTQRLSDKLSVTAEASSGHRGNGATLTMDYDLSANHTIYGVLGHSTDSTERQDTSGPGGRVDGFNDRNLLPGNTLALGHRSRISDQVDIFSEANLSDLRGPIALGHVFGLNWNTPGGFGLSATIQHSDVNGNQGLVDRTAYTFGGRYRSNRTDWASRIEYRDDASINGTEDVTQWASINRLTVKMNEDYRFLARLNYADTEDAQDTSRDTRLVEGGVGLAYRPIDNNRLNWLAKYTYLYDLTSLGQVNTFGLSNNRTDQRSHIWSLEGIRRFGPRWSFGAKVAHRESELRLDRGTGDWFSSTTDFAAIRARWHVVRNWDALAEYRVLSVDEAESTRRGWLVAIDRHIGDHMKIGIGYNFSDFSDDLTLLDFEYDGFFLNVLGKY